MFVTRMFRIICVASSLCLALSQPVAHATSSGPDDDTSDVALFWPSGSNKNSNGSRSRTGQLGVVLAQVNSTKTRARSGDFDAEGQVPCAQERGESLNLCNAGVARHIDGDATVAVTFANGFTRYLYFKAGSFVRASTTMSGSGKDIEWSLVEGLYVLRVDDQRFEIPSKFVLGK